MYVCIKRIQFIYYYIYYFWAARVWTRFISPSLNSRSNISGINTCYSKWSLIFRKEDFRSLNFGVSNTHQTDINSWSDKKIFSFFFLQNSAKTQWIDPGWILFGRSFSVGYFGYIKFSYKFYDYKTTSHQKRLKFGGGDLPY